MTHKELKNLRIGIKFDMRSMALCLGVTLSSYQRWEDGSAAVPVRIERAAKELEQINKTFIRELPKRVDANIPPGGVPNEVRGW